jgi:ankyrin repeat protein
MMASAPASDNLLQAARQGDIGAIRAALAEGASNLDQALVGAVEAGQDLAASYLLDQGASPSAQGKRPAPVAGEAPVDAGVLVLAASAGDAKMVRLLLSRGAGSNGSQLAQALLGAILANQREAVLLLAEQEPAIQTRETAFRLATLAGRWRLAEIFLSDGISREAQVALFLEVVRWRDAAAAQFLLANGIRPPSPGETNEHASLMALAWLDSLARD